MKRVLFKKYAGDYNLPNALVKVWEKDGRYYAQITGQPKFEIFPKSNNRFFMKAMAVEIEFEEGNPAPAMIIHQAGREIKAARK